ncbi:hypothetical protein N752_25315 [Desulforamulus aquiferis]|nr:hypothetical protein N752_25315 [Desulforamulus aquiferis]
MSFIIVDASSIIKVLSRRGGKYKNLPPLTDDQSIRDERLFSRVATLVDRRYSSGPLKRYNGYRPVSTYLQYSSFFISRCVSADPLRGGIHLALLPIRTIHRLSERIRQTTFPHLSLIMLPVMYLILHRRHLFVNSGFIKILLTFYSHCPPFHQAPGYFSAGAS